MVYLIIHNEIYVLEEEFYKILESKVEWALERMRGRELAQGCGGGLGEKQVQAGCEMRVSTCGLTCDSGRALLAILCDP